MRQSGRTRIFREKVRRYNYERGGKIGGAIGDLYQSALGMIPQAVIAVMSGGTSAAAQGRQHAGRSCGRHCFQHHAAAYEERGIHEQLRVHCGDGLRGAKAAGASDVRRPRFRPSYLPAATAGIETMGGIDVPQGSASRLRTR